jgi:protease-4
MLAYPLYFLKYFFWLIGRLKRRFGKGPETVILTLQGDYAQIPASPPKFFVAYFRPPKISLLQLGEQFRRVAADPQVKTVILHIRPLEMPLAKLDILRGYILELQATGKKVIAWSFHYGLRNYYLACAADEIILLPGGDIGPLGIAREYTYLADALAQVGVKADFVQITPYKSAGDMFSRREMSDEVRQMGNWLADAAWDEVLNAIAAGRRLDRADVRAMLDQTPCTDLEAKSIGFVDALLGEDDLPAYLGSEEEPVMLTSWNTALRGLQRKPPRKPGKYVALIGIEGIIVDGNSQQPPIEPPVPVPFGFETRAGDLSVTQVARRVLADERAAALVVYVDSRGGSATASESISASLRKVAGKKPVLVVMGPVAASGGYYIATPGQWIFAQPNTITGSIGVIYGKFALGGLLEKIFVNREVISRGEAALFFDAEKPWSEEQRAKIWTSIQRIYILFLERVADSRKLEIDAVNAIGGGRVWTGRQALEHGLVDELGGLDQAIEKARELGKLRDDAAVRLFYPEKEPTPPVAEPATAIKYVIENFRLHRERAMCLLPWVETR